MQRGPKGLVVCVACLGILMALAARDLGAAQSGEKTLIVATGVDITTLDPQAQPTRWDAIVASNMFDGLLARPQIGWSQTNSRTMLGHFDPAHNAIIISRIFDRCEIPRLLVEYIVFHEMLHLRHPVEHAGARRCVHTREFKQAERAFPRLAEARAMLKKLV